IADADRLRDLDLADDRGGRPLEAVLGIDADLHRAAPIRALLLAPAADAGRDVQGVVRALALRRRRRGRPRALLLARLRLALALLTLLRALLLFLALGRGLLLGFAFALLLGRGARFLLGGTLARLALALRCLAFRGLRPLSRLALGLLALLGL